MHRHGNPDFKTRDEPPAELESQFILRLPTVRFCLSLLNTFSHRSRIYFDLLMTDYFFRNQLKY